MKDLWIFAMEHYFMFFFLAWTTLLFVYNFVRRCQRMLILFARGYPPAHCDADGDFRKPRED